MSQFLDAQTIWNILQRELPNDVYAYGSASAFYTTADMYSAASTMADAYTNLSKIYQNERPDTAVEDIGTWEQTLFYFPIPSLPTLAARQARAVTKLRQTRGISYWDIATFVADFLPGIPVEIRVFNCGPQGDWKFDVSLLDVNTYLNADNYDYQDVVLSQISCIGLQFWTLGVSALASTQAIPTTRLYSASTAAATALRYSYQVNIYDGGATSAATLALLDQELSAAEPARSSHTIVAGFPNPPTQWPTVIPNLTRFDTFAALYSDPTSTTGYTGLGP